MNDRDYSELDAAIAALGLTLSAEFVPQSRSRNAGDKQPSLNWKVTIARGKQSFTTDYTQGIGHVPKYPHGARAAYDRKPFDDAAESGMYPTTRSGFGRAKLTPPSLREVLYSLVMDSSVLDSGGFEQWAAEFGYETDSRKAEATYRECLELAVKFRAMIGDDGLRSLQQAYSDANY